jgi:DNA-binding CsgD family transcriptional regulator
MAGFEGAIVINLFTLKTGLKYILCAYAVSFIITAILQNNSYPISFSVFRVLIPISLSLMLIFFFRLPGNPVNWPRYRKKNDNLVFPKRVFTGLLVLGGLGGLLSFFGGAIAGDTDNGLTIFYLSGVIIGVLVYLLWMKLDISPIRAAKFLTGVYALGICFKIASAFVPEFSFISCILCGSGIIVWTLSYIYGLIMMQLFPSRFIVPAVFFVSGITMIIHTGILETFRDNTAALYMVYLIITIGLVIFYLILEPYFFYSFRNRPLIKNIDPQADEQLKDIDEQTEKSLKEQTGEFSKSLQVSTLDELSYQELRIAELSLKGHTYAEIATALNIKLNTVRWYMKNIYTKLQINSKAELFHLALKQGEVRSE